MRVVLADLKSSNGFVNKDTIVGGYGSRFKGFTWTTRWIERARKVYQNVPSIHAGYLAAIFASFGHEVVFTDGDPVPGDLALVLSSIVDYRQEVAWAQRARRNFGMAVGFFGAVATHMSDVLADHADFLIKGEPEDAAFRLARGETLKGVIPSPAIENLDSLPFPAWHLIAYRRHVHSAGRSVVPASGVFPVLSSRSCPEFCTYCPHRITAPYRSRSPQNVVEEIERLVSMSKSPYLIFRDPLFTEERERSVAIAEGIIRKQLKVRFECETRLDSLDKALIDLLHRAGLRTVTFGVESVEADTLKRVGRRPIPTDHQRDIVRHCRSKGIITHAFYVFGFLSDTTDSIRATTDYAIELGTRVALFKVLTPYPGTPLRKQMEHLITETDLEKFDGYTPTFTHPNLTHAELRFMLASAYARFYVRPSWALDYLGFNGRAPFEWIERVEAFTRREQLNNESAFLSSQHSKARFE